MRLDMGRNQMVWAMRGVCSRMTLNQGFGFYPEEIRIMEGFEVELCN